MGFSPAFPAAGQSTFAFLEFEDERDAEDAVRDRDGYKFDGTRLRVELARGGRRAEAGGRPPAAGGGHGPPQRSEFRVIVENLPPNTSWQDLKDHMRKAGEVGFSEVTRDGEWLLPIHLAADLVCTSAGARSSVRGWWLPACRRERRVLNIVLRFLLLAGSGLGVVEYANADDMKYALRKLDDSEFVSTFTRGRAFIRVREDKPRGGGGGGGSRRSRSRSPDRGRKASRSPSPRKASRSPSPRRGRSPSPAAKADD